MGLVVTGVDPALGGGFALLTADLGDKLTILDCSVTYDLSKTEEQLFLIENCARVYRPNLLIVEFDAQQKGLGNDDRLRDISHRYAFNIRPHTTRNNKADAIFGVASMDQSFKTGEIRIPWGDDTTRNRMGPLVNQLRAWRPDIKTKNLTQDCVMSLWFVWRYWRQMLKQHEPDAAPAWRPSWVGGYNPYVRAS